ncbi:MAG: hypothetical protein J7513_13305 [Solirubrobacteraceae bacterium]|nr:hypothetical protein [Solirubrobacteraceae bacterium]
MPRPLADEFRAARRDPGLVVVEGFHALKHALRFGADIEAVVAATDADLDGLASQLAPELAPQLAVARRVADLAALVPRPPRTGVVAIARRPLVDSLAVIASAGPAPVVMLEQPRTMGNLGACVRVAAAAGAAGLISTGPHDPWHADAVRGGAGLQFALPVARLDLGDDEATRDGLVAAAVAAHRPLVALDPDGAELAPGAPIPARSVLAFGTERDGLSAELLARAGARLRLPMEPGVSSLNLATSVAATLYAWRLAP